MTTVEQRRAWVLTKLIAGEVGDRRGGRDSWDFSSGRCGGCGAAALRRARRGWCTATGGGRRHAVPDRRPGADRGARPGRATRGQRQPSRRAARGARGDRISRVSAAAAAAGGRHRQPAAPPGSRHRSRRDRMPQAGMLLQTDGSRHDWLGERGPRLTLVGAIDDATGIVTGATFREQEDAAGYLTVLRDTVRRHGVPAGALSRSARHLRDARGAAADARGGARRRAAPDPVRAGTGRARHQLYRRPEPAGEGPHRAALGDVPGSPGARAAAWPVPLTWPPAPSGRTHTLHLVERSDPQWRRWLAFRDRLRGDDDRRNEYGALKKELAARYPLDRPSYVAGKRDFIRETVDPD